LFLSDCRDQIANVTPMIANAVPIRAIGMA
jgi:hypothetical protein